MCGKLAAGERECEGTRFPLTLDSGLHNKLHITHTIVVIDSRRFDMPSQDEAVLVALQLFADEVGPEQFESFTKRVSSGDKQAHQTLLAFMKQHQQTISAELTLNTIHSLLDN